MDVTTVADDLVVVLDALYARRYEGLPAHTEHHLDGVSVRTLARPHGELRLVFGATTAAAAAVPRSSR